MTEKWEEETSLHFSVLHFSVAEVFAVKYPELCAGIGSVDGTHFDLPEDPDQKEEWLKYNRSFSENLKTGEGRNEFINALKKRTRKYRTSGWKLNYPEIFMEVQHYPYIVRRPNNGI